MLVNCHVSMQFDKYNTTSLETQSPKTEAPLRQITALKNQCTQQVLSDLCNVPLLLHRIHNVSLCHRNTVAPLDACGSVLNTSTSPTTTSIYVNSHPSYKTLSLMLVY
jgi:hypothetical protein